MSRWVHFRLKLHRDLLSDERVAIVGDGDSLGNWSYKRPGQEVYHFFIKVAFLLS